MKTKHEGVGTQAHYNNFAIEPIDYIVKNGLDFLQGNVIKYVTRAPLKNGVEDLKKARQYIDWLIEREESRDEGVKDLLCRTTHDEQEDEEGPLYPPFNPTLPYEVATHEDDFEEAEPVKRYRTKDVVSYYSGAGGLEFTEGDILERRDRGDMLVHLPGYDVVDRVLLYEYEFEEIPNEPRPILHMEVHDEL